MKKPKAVHIKWLDSYALKDGWGRPDFSLKPLPVCETIGWLMGDDKNFWYVSLNLSHEKDYGYDCADTICIPKVAVTKKKFIVV